MINFKELIEDLKSASWVRRIEEESKAYDRVFRFSLIWYSEREERFVAEVGTHIFDFTMDGFLGMYEVEQGVLQG